MNDAPYKIIPTGTYTGKISEVEKRRTASKGLPYDRLTILCKELKLAVLASWYPAVFKKGDQIVFDIVHREYIGNKVAYPTRLRKPEST